MSIIPHLGYEGQIIDLRSMRMMWIISSGFHFQQITTQYEFQLESANHHHHHLNTKWGIRCKKKNCILNLQESSREFQSQCQGILKLFLWDVVTKHLTRTLYIGVSCNLLPVRSMIVTTKSEMPLQRPTEWRLCVALEPLQLGPIDRVFPGFTHLNGLGKIWLRSVSDFTVRKVT